MDAMFVPVLCPGRAPASTVVPCARCPRRPRSAFGARRGRTIASADNSPPISLPPPSVPSVPSLPSVPTPPPAGVLRTWLRSFARSSQTLWRFSRPHTIYGTLISVVCLHVVAWLSGGWLSTASAACTLLTAVVPALLLNVFIVGLNQYFDVPIDRINKPHLPLAAGTLSPSAARSIIGLTLVGGLLFCLAPSAGWPLRFVLSGSALLGAMYSAPPIRLKRHPLPASVCILSVRGMLVNAGFFLHAMGSHTLSSLTPLVQYAVAFFVLFGVVIALLKDVPDLAGDREYGLRTLTVRVGPQAVFNGCVALLCGMFVAAAGFFALAGSTRFAFPAAVAQIGVAITLARRARGVDAADRKQATEFYMLAWRAFYFEYLLLPFGV